MNWPNVDMQCFCLEVVKRASRSQVLPQSPVCTSTPLSKEQNVAEARRELGEVDT